MYVIERYDNSKGCAIWLSKDTISWVKDINKASVYLELLSAQRTAMIVRGYVVNSHDRQLLMSRNFI